ncbi:MAG TPA: hypothetical protein VF121_17970 [Thermoanaerobaculia bacterium]|nr:hypothetical protein [Thermoanaerobaculia bacterium]
MVRSVLLLAAGLGLAPAPPAAAAADLAQVVAPLPGEALVAGETAWIEWRPGPGLSGFAQAREWEAFLSFDGGESFPVRLTPHLDLDRSRVAFRVPPFASADCRLLLRFGDEREEREQPVPGRFRIVPSPIPRLVLRHRAPARGEAARPGEPGVVVWAEGARDGTGWREVEAWDPGSTLAPAVRPVLAFALAALAPAPDRPAAASRDARVSRLAPPPSLLRGPPRPSLSAPPLLLLLHRLNC